MQSGSYQRFGLMMLTSFIVMYGLMFINADQLDHIMLSFTRTYMALLMIAAMAIIMLLYMLSMYQNKRLNAIILIGSVVAFLGVLALLRTQTPISDEQWMRGMIPHHSSAIMTSQQAHLKDPEAIELAKEIIEAQKREIAQMKKILYRLENSQ
jgi:uncharacterized protein (DUF305 family)